MYLVCLLPYTPFLCSHPSPVKFSYPSRGEGTRPSNFVPVNSLVKVIVNINTVSVFMDIK